MFDNKFMRYMALGTSISTGFIAPVVLGILAGRWLDGHFGSGQWFSLAGVLLGLALGVTSVVQIIRLIERPDKQ